jgi:hypothetical protein
VYVIIVTLFTNEDKNASNKSKYAMELEGGESSSGMHAHMCVCVCMCVSEYAYKCVCGSYLFPIHVYIYVCVCADDAATGDSFLANQTTRHRKKKKKKKKKLDSRLERELLVNQCTYAATGTEIRVLVVTEEILQMYLDADAMRTLRGIMEERYGLYEQRLEHFVGTKLRDLALDSRAQRQKHDASQRQSKVDEVKANLAQATVLPGLNRLSMPQPPKALKRRLADRMAGPYAAGTSKEKTLLSPAARRSRVEPHWNEAIAQSVVDQNKTRRQGIGNETNTHIRNMVRFDPEFRMLVERERSDNLIKQTTQLRSKRLKELKLKKRLRDEHGVLVGGQGSSIGTYVSESVCHT